MFTKTLEQFSELMNTYGAQRIPFFFIIDFECQQPQLFLLPTLETEDIEIQFPNYSTATKNTPIKDISITEKKLISLQEYQKKWDKIQSNLHYGNTFLTNLTVCTSITLNKEVTLHELYTTAKAKYKIRIKNDWVCFTPETFITIQNNTIASFPMKGTIDASIPNATSLILENKKELAEHYTIVDLLRNDMSMVAQNVRVEKFRYIDELKTSNKTLLQVSSKIIGDLPADYYKNIGTILCTMLPAGSISGAPKQKTVDIILETENYKRNYYTGVAGIFDGTTIDSCVLIRFIENTNNGYVYKSGGGITSSSIMQDEYNELHDKIYIAK